MSSAARADMIAYNMTGTIQSIHTNNLFPGQPYSPPVSVGNRIAWTFQYDSSTPLFSIRSGPTAHYYELNNLAVSHLVDTTSGVSLYTPPNVPSTTLTLENLSSGGNFWTSTMLQDTQSYRLLYGVWLDLGSPNTPLPSLNLANLSLAAPPYTSNPGSLEYAYQDFSFQAKTDSISPAAAPEPGSLTLFVLGAVGAAASRLRPRRAGVSRRKGLCPLPANVAGDGHP